MREITKNDKYQQNQNLINHLQTVFTNTPAWLGRQLIDIVKKPYSVGFIDETQSKVPNACSR